MQLGLVTRDARDQSHTLVCQAAHASMMRKGFGTLARAKNESNIGI